jgi:hypothetical protein
MTVSFRTFLSNAAYQYAPHSDNRLSHSIFNGAIALRNSFSDGGGSEPSGKGSLRPSDFRSLANDTSDAKALEKMAGECVKLKYYGIAADIYENARLNLKLTGTDKDIAPLLIRLDKALISLIEKRLETYHTRGRDHLNTAVKLRKRLKIYSEELMSLNLLEQEKMNKPIQHTERPAVQNSALISFTSGQKQAEDLLLQGDTEGAILTYKNTRQILGMLNGDYIKTIGRVKHEYTLSARNNMSDNRINENAMSASLMSGQNCFGLRATDHEIIYFRQNNFWYRICFPAKTNPIKIFSFQRIEEGTPSSKTDEAPEVVQKPAEQKPVSAMPLEFHIRLAEKHLAEGDIAGTVNALKSADLFERLVDKDDLMRLLGMELVGTVNSFDHLNQSIPRKAIRSVIMEQRTYLGMKDKNGIFHIFLSVNGKWHLLCIDSNKRPMVMLSLEPINRSGSDSSNDNGQPIKKKISKSYSHHIWAPEAEEALKSVREIIEMRTAGEVRFCIVTKENLADYEEAPVSDQPSGKYYFSFPYSDGEVKRTIRYEAEIDADNKVVSFKEINPANL